MKTINFDYNYVKTLSNKYSVPEVDVLLIALNRYGLRANIPDKRIRFKLKLNCINEVFYLAVCINTFPSPYILGENNELMLNNEVIGQIFDIEKDTCDSSYFRRNKTEITLNSNMRSQCHGCTFCGTYNLDPDDKVDMSDEGKIADFVVDYMKRNKVNDLSDLLRVTICTGCFSDEMELVKHIISVYRVFKEFGFSNRIHYIGSQIRSDEAMQVIKDSIPFFSLSLTVECFSKREIRMRKEKASLDIDTIHEILSKSLSKGFSTKYLYIVGLDTIEDLRKGIITLADCVNRLPLFQIMQNYVEAHEYERVQEARDIEYYLEARKIIESIFGLNMKPRSWENYRGLFYTQYHDMPLNCIRI